MIYKGVNDDTEKCVWDTSLVFASDYLVRVFSCVRLGYMAFCINLKDTVFLIEQRWKRSYWLDSSVFKWHTHSLTPCKYCLSFPWHTCRYGVWKSDGRVGVFTIMWWCLELSVLFPETEEIGVIANTVDKLLNVYDLPLTTCNPIVMQWWIMLCNVVYLIIHKDLSPVEIKIKTSRGQHFTRV